MRRDGPLAAVVALQAILGLRVLARFAGSAGGRRIQATTDQPESGEAVAVVVPVLNEIDRLAPCLDGLLAQGPEVAEIVVVDGGSEDRTPEMVARYAARDARVLLVDAAPVPAGWNGKSWGLQVGVQRADPRATWILTIDADVRPAPHLARSLLAHARHTGLAAFSVATRQQIDGPGEGLLHPAMLTTLVYRFGLPGNAVRTVSRVQANGQCFLVRRDVLERSQALCAARASPCEDVTMARCLVAAGWEVGFYEAGDLVWADMYAGWRDTWRNWSRSLPLRDKYSGLAGLVGLVEVALVQALPLPLALLLRTAGPLNGLRRWMFATNAMLAVARLGVLFGTARAYRRLPWSYWLSPLCDAPVALLLWVSALRRRHTWRGRTLVTGGAS